MRIFNLRIYGRSIEEPKSIQTKNNLGQKRIPYSRFKNAFRLAWQVYEDGYRPNYIKNC